MLLVKIKYAIRSSKILLIASMGTFFFGVIVATFLFYFFDSNASNTGIFTDFPCKTKGFDHANIYKK